MRRDRFFLIILMGICSAGFLNAGELHWGARLAAHSAIGTGKGYWDWYGAEADTKRFAIPSGTGSLLLQFTTNESWALESGLTYAVNSCGLDVEGEEYIFRQSSVEVPLIFRSYFNTRPVRLFFQGGTGLIYLSGEGSFKSEDEKILIADKEPDRKLHACFIAGLGLDIDREDAGHWILDLRYTTFYTSPEYERTDGTRADIRFHRFELGLGYLF